MAKSKAKRTKASRSNKKKKQSFAQKFMGLPKTVLFIIAFGLVGVVGLVIASAGPNYSMSHKHLNTEKSVNATKVKETRDSKRNAKVVEIKNNSEESVAKATISRDVPAGTYEVCLIGVAQSGSPTGTFSAREFTTRTGNDLGVTTYTAKSGGDYEELACLSFEHKEGDSSHLALYVTNTNPDTSLRISVISVEEVEGNDTDVSIDEEPTDPPSTDPGDLTTLSGSRAIKASCNTKAQYNGTNPRNNFPTDITTGPEASGINEEALPSSGHSGSWTISRNGAVVDGVFHNGSINVKADNVTIKNSVICGNSSIIVDNDGKNLRIENSIIRGEDNGSGDCGAAIAQGNYKMYNTEVTYCADGGKLNGVVEIYNSWFHDFFTNRYGNGGGTHNDTLQKNKNPSLDRLIVKGNSMYQDPCTSNRHLQMGGPDESSLTIPYLRWEDNFMYGIRGFYKDDNVHVSDGLISGNTFAGSATKGPFPTAGLYSWGNGTPIPRNGNLFESGQNADENPSRSSYNCTNI
ncbi:MAG: hypothetical protein U5L95_03635 [Candidatus Saccharibacteria bacterium]|nr:hypothetical protein [Candidatus Saccharibacteria bacterium]